MSPKYTKEEVDQLIRDTLNATAEAMFEWLEQETQIVDRDTKEVLENAEVDLKEEGKSILTQYIYQRLKVYGIEFTPRE